MFKKKSKIKEPKRSRRERREDRLNGRVSSIGETLFCYIGSVVVVGLLGFYAYLGFMAFNYKPTQPIVTTPPLTTDSTGSSLESESIDSSQSEETLLENQTSTESPSQEAVGEKDTEEVSEENNDFSGELSEEEPALNTKTLTIAYDGLNVRTEPRSDAVRLGQVYQGETFIVLDVLTTDPFIKIDYHGEIGYVHEDYVKIN